MSILGPIPFAVFAWIAGGAAALAIGAYIIKMRRRRFEVPFSRLWQRVLEQRDANALWRQLKRLLSLLLILGIIAIMLFAALDPTIGAVDHKARSVVILLDASASMKAMDGNAEGHDRGDQSRLDAAKARAKHLIDGMGGGDVAMVMKVDGQATPMSRFSNDGPMLGKIIDGIAASDTPADLTRALGAAADALRDRPNPLIVLVSDGAFPEQQLGLVRWAPATSPGGPSASPADPKAPSPGAGNAWSTRNLAAVDLSNIDVRYLPVGHRSDNVGIIAFNVRRYIANKAAYEVYIEVQNFGQEPAHRQLTLYNGDTPVDVRTIDLSPGQRIHQIYARLPASADNKLRASLRPVAGPGGSDPFALDDQAYALLPAKKKQKVLLVGSYPDPQRPGNLYLEGALLAYDNIDLVARISAEEYATRPQVADGVDVVVFDDVTPEVLPPPPASLLFFHPTGKGSPIAVRGEVTSPHITEVDEGHPVMRWVTLSDVYMDKSEAFAPDPRKGESTLAFSVTDPVIAAKRDGKRKILAIGFSLPAPGRDSATDLPLRVAFPMLLVNALDWFAGDQTDLLTTYATGSRERVPLDGVVGATEAEVKGPDGKLTHTPVIDGLATFYGMHVGYYDLTAKAPDGSVLARVELAANLSSPEESDIAPSQKLTLGGPAGKQLQEPEAFAITHSQKLWIYLIVFAAGLILVEWITYHRRITV
ncbi:MAG TPA: VWA domain-containing protein [Kofleriaceae bacterium]|nr:VWA domain-containing protein [Kofleriaceae bacterium]